MAEPPRHGRLDREDPLVSVSQSRVHTRPVPAAFAARLAEVFPRREGLSWLLARWEPGDDWDPVERWVIWEVHPWALVPAVDQVAVRGALEGPSPRSAGHYCAAGWCHCDLKKNRWTGGPHEGTDYFRQWEVHRELAQAGTPGFPRIIWIVQGDAGGHPPVMGTVEKQLAAAAQLPTAYPEAGALPYADLDERVIRGLLARDRMRDAEGRLLSRYKTAAELHRDDVEQAQRAADVMFDFIMERTAASAEAAAWEMRRQVGHLVHGRHGDPLVLTDRDAFKQQFIDDMAVVA